MNFMYLGKHKTVTVNDKGLKNGYGLRFDESNAIDKDLWLFL